jgi:Flp pilus assembly protein TadD
MNTDEQEHPTSNIEGCHNSGNHWMLDIGCWMLDFSTPVTTPRRCRSVMPDMMWRLLAVHYLRITHRPQALECGRMHLRLNPLSSIFHPLRLLFNRAAFLPLLAAATALAASDRPDADALVHQKWFEARTAHFHLYSCGPTQEVARLAARLEQFRDAYSILAGAQAVASPPITVLAFPDHAALRPFLPLYDGKPANLRAFFNRGSDENLIALSLSGPDAGSLPAIFHEYTHVLLRHNEPYWPMWLVEGMAEIYATFAVHGGHRTSIGSAQQHHVRLLEQRPLMPLHQLFAVGRNSPEYNEREHQGVFYAESWLLTHYLMMGNNPAIKANFSRLTPLLRLGQSPEQAFTNALQTSLPAMEAQLRHYLERGKFEPIELAVSSDLDAPHSFVTRRLTTAEVCYLLGDELLRIGRAEAAESFFEQAQGLAPKSPLPYEGLGQLAAQRGERDEALRLIEQALKLGPVSYLTHYTYARERFLQAAGGPMMHTLDKAAAAQIRAELQKSLSLMPDFGPSHYLLGFFELVQDGDLTGAEKQIRLAVQLVPENESYLLILAQIQMARNDPAAARRTLEPLRLPYVPSKVRADAEELLKTIGRPNAPGR